MAAKSVDRFAAAFPQSRLIAQQAGEVIAGGVAHDSWHLHPYPVAFVSADGAWKESVDGRSLVDLWMGHGSLILGHRPAEVLAACRASLATVSHVAGLSPLQIEWARLIREMVPCAERVRFTASGTEATLLALRVARSATGRPRIVRIDGHFHGWHDEVMAGYVDPVTAGLDPTAIDGLDLVPPDDLAIVADHLDGQVAAVILEPGGGSSSALNHDVRYLRGLRDIAREAGCLLIFDEVITGFREAPGGVQEASGVESDLAVLGKIVCGGLPGGALVGRTDIMAVFGGALSPTASKVAHTGTFNGNPLSAAAGIATLRRLRDGRVQRLLADRAARLVKEINEAAADRKVDIRLFAQGSIIHLLIGAVGHRVAVEAGVPALRLQQRQGEAHQVLRRLLMVEGVDMHPTKGWLSLAHDDSVCARLVAVFDRVFADLTDVPDWPVASCSMA